MGKINELAAYLSANSPDLVLICETWTNPLINDAVLNIPGYQLESDLRCDRKDTKNGIGGGLVVYSKTGLKILPCDKFDYIGFNQLTAFLLKTTGEMLNIVLIYRPPKYDSENIEKLCQIIHRAEKNTIIIGDANLPGVCWTQSRSGALERPVLAAMEEEGMAQLVTFAPHKKGNILDII